MSRIGKKPVAVPSGVTAEITHVDCGFNAVMGIPLGLE